METKFAVVFLGILVLSAIFLAGGLAFLPGFVAGVSDFAVKETLCIRDSDAQVTFRARVQNLGSEDMNILRVSYRDGPAEVVVGDVSGLPILPDQQKLIGFRGTSVNEIPAGKYTFVVETESSIGRIVFTCQ